MPPDLGPTKEQDSDIRADRDVYALGITLYEAITASYAWPNSTVPVPGQSPRAHGLFMIARIFRRNSGIAVLVVTGLLAWLTSRYVRLTREIANSSLEQVKLIGESARVDLQHNASALKALALRLRVSAPRFFVLKDYHRQTSPRSDYGSFSLALE